MIDELTAVLNGLLPGKPARTRKYVVQVDGDRERTFGSLEMAVAYASDEQSKGHTVKVTELPK